MRQVNETIAIDAPREQVFALIADLANRPAFCDHFLEQYHLQRLESRGVGSAARFRVGAPRFPIWMETVIVSEEAPHRVIESGRGSKADRMAIGTAWELVERPGPTTEVELTFWIEPENHVDRAFSRLGAGRWYRKRWRTALRRLRDLVESGSAPERVEVAGASRPG